MLVVLLEYGHGHVKNEVAASVDSLGLNTNLPSTRLNYLSNNCEPKADSITIDLRSAVQFAKLLEDLLKVFSSDADATI